MTLREPCVSPILGSELIIHDLTSKKNQQGLKSEGHQKWPKQAVKYLPIVSVPHAFNAGPQVCKGRCSTTELHPSLIPKGFSLARGGLSTRLGTGEGRSQTSPGAALGQKAATHRFLPYLAPGYQGVAPRTQQDYARRGRGGLFPFHQAGALQPQPSRGGAETGGGAWVGRGRGQGQGRGPGHGAGGFKNSA